MKECSKCIYSAMCLPLGKLSFVRILYLQGLPAQSFFIKLPETACGLFRPIYSVIKTRPSSYFKTTWHQVADHVNSLPSA